MTSYFRIDWTSHKTMAPHVDEIIWVVNVDVDAKVFYGTREDQRFLRCYVMSTRKS
jgi:hypothetical protein